MSFLRNTLVAAFLFIGGITFAQDGQQTQKLVKVANLGTFELNQEFDKNVRLVQTQRTALIQLMQAQEAETDSAKKEERQKQIDQLTAKLNDNNQKMYETYGFTLNRNYTRAIVNSAIFMHVTDEEAAKIEAAAAAAKKDAE